MIANCNAKKAGKPRAQRPRGAGSPEQEGDYTAALGGGPVKDLGSITRECGTFECEDPMVCGLCGEAEIADYVPEGTLNSLSGACSCPSMCPLEQAEWDSWKLGGGEWPEDEDEDPRTTRPRSARKDLSGASATYLNIASLEWRARILIFVTSTPKAASVCAPVTRGVWPPKSRIPVGEVRGWPIKVPRHSKVVITAAFFGIRPSHVGNRGEPADDLNLLSWSHRRCSTARW